MKIFLFVIMIIVFSGCIFTPPKTLSVSVEDEYLFDDSLLQVAKEQIGVPYRYGGISPDDGFDCSGFVSYVYKNGAGIKLPRTSRAQSQYGRLIDKSELRSGDILFFDTSHKGHINHSGIYIGGGKFIHASSGKAHSVTISSLNSGFYKRTFRWARRIN
jgi:cell wall-associated NlpC family hydrolase